MDADGVIDRGGAGDIAILAAQQDETEVEADEVYEGIGGLP